MNRYQLQLRHNNAYDSVLLLVDGRVRSVWSATPNVMDDFRTSGDLSDWADHLLDEDPEDYGDLLESRQDQSKTRYELRIAVDGVVRSVWSVNDDDCAEILDNMVWHVLPHDEGQIATISYSCDSQYLYRRRYDRSDRSSTTHRARLIDDDSEFEPWNGRLPNHRRWEQFRGDLR